MNRTGFTEPDFRRLGATTSEAEAVECLLHKVDQLIALVNGLSVGKAVIGQRSRIHGREVISKFFTDRGEYVRGGPGHWYVYNWGGRWEPQFNIGMFGVPGRGYVRVGLGFNLTNASTDPDRDAGAATVRALFAIFQSLVRTDLRPAVVRMLSRPRSIVEHGSRVPDPFLTTGERTVSWLSTLENPVLERWVFLGRALRCDVEQDGEILADVRELTRFVGEEFEAWLPVWTKIWAAA